MTFLTWYPTSGRLSNNASQLPVNKNRIVKKAWAPISGMTNWQTSGMDGVFREHVWSTRFQDSFPSHLVEFVAQVDGVDVIAFQIGEHDDLEPRMRVRKGAHERRLVV